MSLPTLLSPREIRKTLFTWHNQTVVPLLDNTKKASLQAVHTSFVNTGIDNMTNMMSINEFASKYNVLNEFASKYNVLYNSVSSDPT